jgi:hypothetical protein
MFKNHKLKEVLLRAYLDPFKLQSDYARDNAQAVAALACTGFISTHTAPGQFGNKWRIRGLGIDKLEDLGLL